jgi:hypothetical protein
MKQQKITYFEDAGEKNTNSTIEAAYERAKEGDIKYVVVASHRGNTVLKLAEKFKDLDVQVVGVTVAASTKQENIDAWNKHVPEMEKLGVKMHRGIYSFAGVERAIKARWGGAGPAVLMGDTLRILGEGVKVGVDVSLMAADAGMIPVGEKVMTIAGTSRGADTCMIVKSAFSSKFFDLAIQEIVCKPYTDGIKHDAR